MDEGYQSLGDLLEVARKKNYEVSSNDLEIAAKRFLEQHSKYGQLSDSDLDNVAGGTADIPCDKTLLMCDFLGSCLGSGATPSA